MIRHSC